MSRQPSLDPIPPTSAISLTHLPGMTPARLAKLRSLWATTVQDLQGIAELPGGREYLQSLLVVDEIELDALLGRAAGMSPRGDDSSQERWDEVMKLEYGSGAVAMPQERSGERYDTIAFAGKLPAVVNYTDQLSPPRNQGVRGTCVAYAAAAVREHLEVQAGLAQAGDLDLSEQFIYWWCKEQDNLPDVSGTYPHLGMTCLAEIGTALETTWPYDPEPRLGDEGQGPPPAAAMEEAAKYRIKRVIKLEPTDVDSLKTALADGRAIVFAIPIFNSWYRNRVTRRFGKIGMPWPHEQSQGAHAMAMVGYVDDDDAPGGGYFLLRNSWSPWGYDNSLGENQGAIPFAFISEYCLSATTGDRSSKADVYIRDNVQDDGEVPSPGLYFNSPDIWVRHEDDGGVDHQSPRGGKPNWVHVRAWNRGPEVAQHVEARVYTATASPSIWPHHWQEIGEILFAPIDVGEASVGALTWTPQNETQSCFLVRLTSAADPVQHEWSVRHDNNLAQKNLVLVDLQPGSEQSITFLIHGVPDELAAMDIKVDRSAFPRGRVMLGLSPRRGGGGALRLVENEGLWSTLALQATATEEVELTIQADVNAQPGDLGEIVLTQHKGQLLVGRLIVSVRIF